MTMSKRPNVCVQYSSMYADCRRAEYECARFRPALVPRFGLEHSLSACHFLSPTHRTQKIANCTTMRSRSITTGGGRSGRFPHTTSPRKLNTLIFVRKALRAFAHSLRNPLVFSVPHYHMPHRNIQAPVPLYSCLSRHRARTLP